MNMAFNGSERFGLAMRFEKGRGDQIKIEVDDELYVTSKKLTASMV